MSVWMAPWEEKRGTWPLRTLGNSPFLFFCWVPGQVGRMGSDESRRRSGRTSTPRPLVRFPNSLKDKVISKELKGGDWGRRHGWLRGWTSESAVTVLWLLPKLPSHQGTSAEVLILRHDPNLLWLLACNVRREFHRKFYLYLGSAALPPTVI